jgi:hypothetical protein
MSFDMYEYSSSSLVERLKEEREKIDKRINKIFWVISVFIILIALIILLSMVNSMFNVLTYFLFFLGLSVIELFLSFIIKSVGNYQFVNQVLHKEMIAMYNQNEEDSLRYRFKPKDLTKFNVNMALFNRYSGANIPFAIEQNDASMPYLFMKASLVTSSGKSSTVHFDGMYLRIKKSLPDDFHIKPKKTKSNRKNAKMYHTEIEGHHVYVPEYDYIKEERSLKKPFPSYYIDFYNSVVSIFNTDKIYIGSDKEFLDIAIYNKFPFKAPKDLDYDTIHNYYRLISGLLSQVKETLLQVDTYF